MYPSNPSAKLQKQLDSLNLDHIEKAFQQSKKNEEDLRKDKIDVIPKQLIIDLEERKKRSEEWWNIGMENIDKIGILLLAGGQGTRLGFDLPKGLYQLGLPSESSLFEIQAKNILKLQLMSGKKVKIPWYIMTSVFTYDETKEFFEQKNYFGLDTEQVIFFNQGLMPCFTVDGKFIMKNNDEIAMAPDGNGGVYLALHEHGIIDHMKKNGIMYIHSYCVDNVLCKVGDPTFVGMCIQKDVEFGAKVTSKEYPSEKVGVFALKNSKLCVVEYSEMPEEIANDPKFDQANIVNFYYSVGFLEKCIKLLTTSYHVYHIAPKRIKTDDGPKQGIKLEQFNFDVCQFADKYALFYVNRNEEFAPLKNATGKDSPETCRALLKDRNLNYLKNAGHQIDSDELIEIDPVVSYQGEGLEKITIENGSIKLT